LNARKIQGILTYMITFALMLLALTAGYLMRAYMERPTEVLSDECKTLVSAMRETEIESDYWSGGYPEGVYTVYVDGARVIRWFDSVRVRLLCECGFTLAYCGNGINF